MTKISDKRKGLENEFKKWYHENNGDVTSTQIFNFGVSLAQKEFLHFLEYLDEEDVKGKGDEIMQIIMDKIKELKASLSQKDKGGKT